ncbi:G-box-binding factor 2 [Carex littledalei]|uniref:G-box-binding factor 2 n=1 Tax=Carex littledalei TaxID=544730 RepID=A0A833V4S5_9POAL|nr:G-box-binding factor 2 [Carex littledalei]
MFNNLINSMQTSIVSMLSLQQTIPLNSPLLEQEPIFGFGYTPWSAAPDPYDTSNDNTGQENAQTLEESRRLRRMKSNRESARRSRMRKRIHLEELKIQFDQLQAQNCDLRSQLGFVLNRYSLIRHENRRLQIEALLFKRRLDEAQALILVSRRLGRVSGLQNFHAFGNQGPASALASLIA